MLDSTNGDLVAYAPIRDSNSVYTDNGYLRPLGFLDEDSVLLLVAQMDFRSMDIGEETWQLVAWGYQTNQYQRLTSGATEMAAVEVAIELIR